MSRSQKDHYGRCVPLPVNIVVVKKSSEGFKIFQCEEYENLNNM